MAASVGHVQGLNPSLDGLRIMAARARRLAWVAGDEKSSTKLIEFAEELEQRAAALETAPGVISHSEAAAIQMIEADVDPEPKSKG